jgi:hypothetical protein
MLSRIAISVVGTTINVVKVEHPASVTRAPDEPLLSCRRCCFRRSLTRGFVLSRFLRGLRLTRLFHHRKAVSPSHASIYNPAFTRPLPSPCHAARRSRGQSWGDRLNPPQLKQRDRPYEPIAKLLHNVSLSIAQSLALTKAATQSLKPLLSVGCDRLRG